MARRQSKNYYSSFWGLYLLGILVFWGCFGGDKIPVALFPKDNDSPTENKPEEEKKETKEKAPVKLAYDINRHIRRIQIELIGSLPKLEDYQAVADGSHDSLINFLNALDNTEISAFFARRMLNILRLDANRSLGLLHLSDFDADAMQVDLLSKITAELKYIVDETIFSPDPLNLFSKIIDPIIHEDLAEFYTATLSDQYVLPAMHYFEYADDRMNLSFLNSNGLRSLILNRQSIEGNGTADYILANIFCRELPFHKNAHNLFDLGDTHTTTNTFAAAASAAACKQCHSQTNNFGSFLTMPANSFSIDSWFENSGSPATEGVILGKTFNSQGALRNIFANDTSHQYCLLKKYTDSLLRFEFGDRQINTIEKMYINYHFHERNLAKAIKWLFTQGLYELQSQTGPNYIPGIRLLHPFQIQSIMESFYPHLAKFQNTTMPPIEGFQKKSLIDQDASYQVTSQYYQGLHRYYLNIIDEIIANEFSDDSIASTRKFFSSFPDGNEGTITEAIAKAQFIQLYQLLTGITVDDKSPIIADLYSLWEQFYEQDESSLLDAGRVILYSILMSPDFLTG